jgi:hypothetical protein
MIYFIFKIKLMKALIAIVCMTLTLSCNYDWKTNVCTGGCPKQGQKCLYEGGTICLCGYGLSFLESNEILQTDTTSESNDELEGSNEALQNNLMSDFRNNECCYCPDGRVKQYKPGQCMFWCQNFCNNILALCQNPCGKPPK